MNQETGVLTVSALTPRSREEIIPLESTIKKMLE